MAMDIQPTRAHATEVKAGSSQEKEHPFMVGEQMGVLKINDPESIFHGMEIPIPYQRREMSINVVETLISEVRNPVEQLLKLVENVSNQSFAQGEKTYMGEDRKILINRILESLLNSPKYKKLIGSFAEKSSALSKVLIHTSVFLLSNTNYLRAIIGYVVDGWSSATAPYRIQEFEEALREASWKVQQDRDPSFYHQTNEGHFTVQTELDPTVAFDLFAFYRLAQKTETVGAVPTESAVSTKPDFDNEADKDAYVEQVTEKLAAEKRASAQPVARLKRKVFGEDQSGKGESLPADVRPLTPEDEVELQQERSEFALEKKLERLEHDFRAAVVGVTISNKIHLIQEAVSFLETDYGEEKATLTKLDRITKALGAKLTGRTFSPESAEAFLRLQEVYRFDPNSTAVHEMLSQQFGLDLEEIKEMYTTNEGRGNIDILIRRAKAIVTHGFTRNSQHGIAEITFDEAPRHFVILVHGTPYKIEYYNKDGFVSQDKLVRIVQNLEHKHAEAATDSNALEMRQVIAAIWTELGYNPKKNSIITDFTMLERYIQKFLKKDLKKKPHIVKEISRSILMLAQADFSVSIGAEEVPSFGADDQGGEVTTLVFGGQHIDISDNLHEFCAQLKDDPDDIYIFNQERLQTDLRIKINSGFDHGITDGREAQETNAELSNGLTQYLLSKESIGASRRIVADVPRAEELCLGVHKGELVFDKEKVITENTREYCFEFPQVPDSLAKSPKALSKELDKSIEVTTDLLLSEHLAALERMSMTELFDNAGMLIDTFTNVTVNVQMERIFPVLWEEKLAREPAILLESPKSKEATKNAFYAEELSKLREKVRQFLSGETELSQELQDTLGLKAYDFSVAAKMYGIANVTDISALQYQRYRDKNGALVSEGESYNILQQYEHIQTISRKIKKRFEAVQNQKNEAQKKVDNINDILNLNDIYDELQAQVSSTEEADIKELIQEMKQALKQMNTALTHCMYDKHLFVAEGEKPSRDDDPLLAQIDSLQLSRISWVTAVHYGGIVTHIMSMFRDDIRPALKKPPTSRNIAEIPTNRLDFHTLTGYEETMQCLQEFALVWGDTNKDADNKENVIEAFKKIVQDYVVNYSIPFQVGVDQARKQVSDTSVLSAGTNRFTQWLLDVSLRYTGNMDVLAQQRSSELVSAVHANPGVRRKSQGFDLSEYSLARMSEGFMTPEEHRAAVLKKEHGQSSFHTAQPKDNQTALGVTYVHDPENPHISIKGRMAITDEHLDQIAMEMLGVERNLAREVVENIAPRYYFNALSVEQRREAVQIAKRELAEQTKSMYYWYFFINVVTKMDKQAVAQRYDEWVASESQTSFMKYVMEVELARYDLSEEALDFYKNGPRLNA